ncbi:MAG: hypothetical protein MPN21_26225 [Thermoanaerobaculia bacterium]|nr:hypothetical protein [Thermoanaerobaculia bacterium]
MRFWLVTLMVIGLLVLAVWLTAGYVLVDGGDPGGWLRETMALVGIPSAVVLIGSSVILTRCRSRDLLMKLGLAVLVGIGTVLVATVHLSLLHGLPLKAVLATDFLLQESLSVWLALGSALGIHTSTLLLAWAAGNEDLADAEKSVQRIEREVQAELARLQVEHSTERAQLGGDDVSVTAVCEYCGWRTTKPNFSRAQQALRGHWAHCKKKRRHRGFHLGRD